MWYVQKVCGAAGGRGAGAGAGADARVSQERRGRRRGCGVVLHGGGERRAPPSHQRARLYVERVLRRPPAHSTFALAVLFRVRTRIGASFLASVVSLHVFRKVV